MYDWMGYARGFVPLYLKKLRSGINNWLRKAVRRIGAPHWVFSQLWGIDHVYQAFCSHRCFTVVVVILWIKESLKCQIGQLQMLSESLFEFFCLTFLKRGWHGTLVLKCCFPCKLSKAEWKQKVIVGKDSVNKPLALFVCCVYPHGQRQWREILRNVLSTKVYVFYQCTLLYMGESIGSNLLIFES